MSTRQVDALGSVRGIAALIVLLGHCSLAFRLAPAIESSLCALLNQRGAVIVFFVLSGYVLTLSLARNGEVLAYYARRLFRIMPALWLASGLAWLLLDLAPPALAAPSSWTAWTVSSYHPVPVAARLRAFTGFDNRLIPPTWTIAAELVGSLCLPLLVAIARRGQVQTLLMVAALAILSVFTVGTHGRLQLAGYLVEFAMGAAVALHVRPVPARAARLATVAGAGLLLAARPLTWLLLTGSLQPVEYHIDAPLPMLVEALGACLLLAGLTSGTLTLRFLHWRPVLLLGDWSYSLYLYHFAFLRLILHILPPLPAPAATVLLTAGTLLLTVPVAAFSYRHVELPCIAIGKRLLQHTRRRTAAAAQN